MKDPIQVESSREMGREKSQMGKGFDECFDWTESMEAERRLVEVVVGLGRRKGVSSRQDGGRWEC